MAIPRLPQRFVVPCIVAVVLMLFAVLLVLITVRTNRAAHRPAPHTTTGRQTVPQNKQLKQQQPPAPLYAFPKGGQTLLPSYRLVALYGTPGVPRMGILGEQPAAEAIARVKALAAQHQASSAEHILPTLEIISTVASSAPTSNGDYSKELEVSALQPWVDAAKAAGVYVVLDLQPGRTDFLAQAKQYEPLLKEPHVGLALDPEWRLRPDQVHLQQIGSVAAAEVNATAAWLADLTNTHHLPQKLFLLHQFRLSMIANREHLDTSRKELAYIIQMDGNGAQPTKLETWNSIRQQAPQGVVFGWKNFYDEDHPILTPEQTMQIVPQPWYISYQ